MAESSIYEIHAKGRDTLTFLDAYKAGEAFYSVRREEMPKVERFDPAPNGGERIGIYAALTGKSPNGYEHIFLDAGEKFRAGYEAARERMPEKAIPLHDAQQPPQQPTQGPTMPDQQAPASSTQQAAAAPTMAIDGKPVVHVEFHKYRNDNHPDYQVAFKAVGPDGAVVKEGEDVRKSDLDKLLPKDIAQGIITRPDQRGHFMPQELPQPERMAPTPAQAPQQAKAPEPAAEQVHQQPNAAAPQREAPSRAVEAAPAVAAAPAPQTAEQPKANTLELVAERQPEKAQAVQQAEPPKGPTREQLRASLEQRFEVASVGTLLKPADEYRFKGDGPLRIAFTDLGKQFSTALDTKEVVKGMADLAQAKGWREINVNGTPEFKRSMWMEGNLRGIHVAGYSPSKEDHERLKAARAELAPQQQPKAQLGRAPEQAKNTVEAGPARQPGKQQEQAQRPAQVAAPGKEAAPRQAQGSSRAQYLMAAKSVLTEQGVDAKTIDKAMESLGRKIDTMVAAGQTLPKLHVFDRAAPSLQPVPTVTVQPTVQPGREVAAPGR